MDSEDSGQWGIAELMGHKVVAGFVSKSEMLGKPMLRVDVPATSAYPAFTQFYGETAIYCVTFVSEEVARRTAEANKVNPVSVYVPDLVTKEAFEEAEKRYRKSIENYQKQLADVRGLSARRAEYGDDESDRSPCGECGRMCDEGMTYCPTCGNMLSQQ